MAQIKTDGTMESDNPEYDAFVEKFKPKKTTDDCYTPPEVYEAVADFVATEYNLDRKNFVRPFYPGGDYQRYEYKPCDIVVDNPPFSIVTSIVSWYQQKGIKFFLFAPALTLFNSIRHDGVCAVVSASEVIYENGARVKTDFLTNLDAAKVRTAPALTRALEDVEKARQAKTNCRFITIQSSVSRGQKSLYWLDAIMILNSSRKNVRLSGCWTISASTKKQFSAQGF